jgi:hypothetical protein
MPEPTWGQSNKRSRRSCRTVMSRLNHVHLLLFFSLNYECIHTNHSFLHLLDMKRHSTVKRHVHNYMYIYRKTAIIIRYYCCHTT